MTPDVKPVYVALYNGKAFVLTTFAWGMICEANMTSAKVDRDFSWRAVPA